MRNDSFPPRDYKKSLRDRFLFFWAFITRERPIFIGRKILSDQEGQPFENDVILTMTVTINGVPHLSAYVHYSGLYSFGEVALLPLLRDGTIKNQAGGWQTSKFQKWCYADSVGLKEMRHLFLSY